MRSQSVTQLLRRAATTTGPTTAALSRETVGVIQRRLAKVCLIYGTAYAVAFVPGMLLVELPNNRPPGHPEFLAMAAILVALTIGVALHRISLGAPQLMRVSVVLWAVGVIGIDLPSYGSYLQYDMWPWQISWSCVWIVIFPLVVPGPPALMTFGAVIAGLLGLGSFATAAAIQGLPAGTEGLPAYVDPRAYFVQLTLSYVICAGIAAFSARLVYGLQRQAESARRLGSYELENKLGEGGMGEVWLARHHLLARPAAVKLIRREHLLARGGRDSATALRRFEREAQATAELRSLHTVQLYDFGATDDGAFYYAMEYLDGIDLQQLIERYGPLPAPRVIHILEQICDSLAEAHQLGLVHRDIKPSNVLLCKLGGHYDVVKIVDFGLVKPTADSRPIATQLTVEGTVPGTPAYMPPEIAMSHEDTDPRSDLYSMGCVAYWMLTGRQVFLGNTPMEVVLQHARDVPAPPSSLTELDIPSDLEELILDLLAKSPADRPESARAVLKRLADQRANTWTEADAEDWWRLHGNDELARRDAEITPAGAQASAGAEGTGRPT